MKVLFRVVYPLFIYEMIQAAVLAVSGMEPLAAATAGALISIPVFVVLLGKERGWGRDFKVFFSVSAFYVIPVLVLGISLCIFVNNLFEIGGLTKLFSGFKSVAEDLYGPSVRLQLLGSALVIPIAEELVFRGFVFAGLREKMDFRWAVFWSSLIFGALHGNLLQGMYAFIMGYVLAWLLERTKSVAAPVMLHCVCNLTSVIVTNSDIIGEVFSAAVPFYIITVVSGCALASAIQMIRQHKEV